MSWILCALVVDSLMFAIICTRQDIAHVVGVVSQYITNPNK